MQYTQVLSLIGLSIIFVCLLFIALRSLSLWYWKIDEIIKLLKQISENTKSQKKE